MVVGRAIVGGPAMVVVCDAVMATDAMVMVGEDTVREEGMVHRDPAAMG